MVDRRTRGGGTPVAPRPPTRRAQGWALNAYHACDLVCRIVALNVLWIGFTLLGGVVLGAAPATVAAHALARRYLRGESPAALPAFWRAWRTEFVRANVLLLPAAAIAVLLWLNWRAFAPAAGLGGTVVAGAVLLTAVLVAAWSAVLVPLYVHYDLPLRSYPVVASRFVLANPASAALLVVVAAGTAAITAAVPGLLPFLSVGAWIHVDTALCLSFFHRNDARVAEIVTDEQGSSR